jgi:class 3 adenylate cyclase
LQALIRAAVAVNTSGQAVMARRSPITGAHSRRLSPTEAAYTRSVLLCSQCGQENPEGFRFCGGCGAALAEAAPPREVRKTVTLLFCDVAGSTTLGELLDPETLRRVMRRYFDEIGAVIERHGGTVEKFVGDAVMAVFGVPRVREDDALRAVRAAAEIRESLPAVAADLGVELVFRTGVNTGEVMVGDGQTFATGDAVNVAARLEQAAAPGEILIGAQTLQLVRDAVDAELVDPLALRGKADPVPAHRLVSVRAGAPGHERRLDAPLVGRRRELRLLRDVFDRAVDERRSYLFTLLGAAGVGKSRLVREFLGDVAGEAMVVRGRCLAYGEGITFYPLVEVLMQLGDPAEDVLARVTQGGAASAGELYFDVRRLLEQLASERPIIVVLDDLHWAEATLLDLLDHVADLSRSAPILLLCIARPELLEERSDWAGGKVNATTVLLEPLPHEMSEALVERMASGLDAEAQARVVTAGEGNPLFLEEMVALVQEGGGTDVPPTIQALLAARLERLDEAERSVIERGAVEGKVFHRGAVRELAPPALREGVDSNLAALVRKELIRPDEPVFAGDEAYRFRHLLIRDAAYDALPKGQRAELHAAFAGWLEEHGSGLVELDEIAAWHLEQALGFWRQLGLPTDAALSERAAEHLLEAGRRAASRWDSRAAENLLRRSFDLLPLGHRRRGRVALTLAETLLRQGRFETVEALIGEAEAEPDLGMEAVLVRQEWLMHSRPDEATAYSDRELPAVIAHFERLGDHALLAKAHFARVRMCELAGTFGPAVDEAVAAADHARRAGDRGLLTQALIFASWGLLFGPADEAATRHGLSEIDASDAGHIYGAFALAGRAVLAANTGRFDEARALFRETFDLLDELGLEVLRHTFSQWTSQIELEAGDPAAAVADLSRARDELDRLGERAYRSTCTALLADALYADGRRRDAEQMANAAEAESAAEDSVNFAIADGVRARIAADRGEIATAERLADSAVGFAFRMDMPKPQADALCARACVLLASGRRVEAAEVLDRAIAIYERKGELAAARRARSAFSAASAAG